MNDIVIVVLGNLIVAVQLPVLLLNNKVSYKLVVSIGLTLSGPNQNEMDLIFFFLDILALCISAEAFNSDGCFWQ